MKILEEKDIHLLLKSNDEGAFGPRNRLAILAAALWGLTASELSLLTIGDVIDETGEIRPTWILPVASSSSGKARQLMSNHPRMCEALDGYLLWLVQRGLCSLDDQRYRGLDPKAALLRNDRGGPFALTARSKDTPDDLQPSGMNTLFRRLIAATPLAGEVTFSDFRRSFVAHLARPTEGGLRVREIMEVTGMKDYDSVKRIVAMDPDRTVPAVRGIYNRL